MGKSAIAQTHCINIMFWQICSSRTNWSWQQSTSFYVGETLIGTGEWHVLYKSFNPLVRITAVTTTDAQRRLRAKYSTKPRDLEPTVLACSESLRATGSPGPMYVTLGFHLWSSDVKLWRQKRRCKVCVYIVTDIMKQHCVQWLETESEVNWSITIEPFYKGTG